MVTESRAGVTGMGHSLASDIHMYIHKVYVYQYTYVYTYVRWYTRTPDEDPYILDPKVWECRSEVLRAQPALERRHRPRDLHLRFPTV